MFREDDLEVTVHIHTWLTDCQPKIKNIDASCYCCIDDGQPPWLSLSAGFEMLGNINSQDLCNAAKASDYTKLCSTDNELEFHHFSCKEQANNNPPETWEKAKFLKFVWKDSYGIVIGNNYSINLDFMPSFPVTLSVENEWGNVISETIPIQQKPTVNCPPPKPIRHLYAPNLNENNNIIPQPLNPHTILIPNPFLKPILPR